MLDCWKIAISSPHTLRQCRYIFSRPLKDQTHATTFRKLLPRAALTEKPCVAVLFWNLDASSGLGAYAMAYAMPYFCTPSLWMYKLSSMQQERDKIHAASVKVTCTCEPGGKSKHSPGPTLSLKCPVGRAGRHRIGAMAVIPSSSRRFKEHRGLTLPSHRLPNRLGGNGYVAGTVSRSATLK